MVFSTRVRTALALLFASVQALFADLAQDLVQTRVSVNQRKLRGAGRKDDFVNPAAERDFSPENARERCGAFRPDVNHRHACRNELPSSQEAVDPDCRDDEELDLVAGGVPRDVRIAQALGRLRPLAVFQDEGLIGDPTIPRSALKRRSERVRGGKDVVQQPYVSAIELCRQRQSQSVITERLGSGIQEGDLTLHCDTIVGIADLLLCQAGAQEHRLQVDLRTPQTIRGKPCQTCVNGWQGCELPHERTSHVSMRFHAINMDTSWRRMWRLITSSVHSYN